VTTCRLILACLTLSLSTLAQRQPPFDSVKSQIARYESHYGKYRVNRNPNGTTDLGYYQINSRNLEQSRDTLCTIFNRIFQRYGIGRDMKARMRATRTNDRLNEDLARALYDLRGIRQWTSSYKFLERAKTKQKRGE
jgi:hypothetical protein